MNKVYKPTASDYIYKALLDELLEEEAYKFKPNEDYPEITYENAGEIIDSADDFFTGDYPEDSMWEVKHNFRDSGEDCNELLDTYSRHYEVDFVVKLIDDKWVGWNYYYGGGKYEEPDAIDWIEDAVFLEVVSEKEFVKVVRTFKRV